MSTREPDSPHRAGPDPQAGISRRQFLIGGGVLLGGAVAAGAAGWRSWTVRDYWYRLTGAYGEPGTPPPAYAVTYERGTLQSRYLAEAADYAVASAPGVASGGDAGPAATPVCLCLPGRGRSPGELLQGNLRFGDFVADGIVARGVAPFAVAAVQASDTYWHRRENGDDAMAMLFDEFIPFLRRDLSLGGPLAVMGWSMGGYGALRAAELEPQRFRGVCAVSPALWRSFDEGVGDAFDSAADFAANDAFADAGRLRGMPVRLDCGRQDPFYAADTAFADTLTARPAGGFEPGGHNDAYWSRVAPSQVDFIGRVLGGASAGA